MILVDVMNIVLANEDSEYLHVVQRAILIMIETSEIVSASNQTNLMTDNTQSKDEKVKEDDVVSVAQISCRGLANLAIFDYLAEKLSYLCYERSWYAKKARYTFC